MIPIRWPKGPTHQDLARACKRHKDIIKKGRVLAVDPASGKTSNPGYAFWVGGKLIEYGDINVDPTLSTQVRLGAICDCLVKEFPAVDVLAIELLRGPRIRPALWWSVGAVVSHVRPPILLETPTWTWKALAKATEVYTKSDDLDALLIGGSVMALAGIEERFL